MDENEIAYKDIGACIEVHKNVGPELLESAYQACLMREFDLQGICYEYEVPIQLDYKNHVIQEAYRADLLVDNKVLVELKVVKKTEPIHQAQLLTYLKLSGKRLGLLINFNELVLKQGITRVVNNL